jgi:hypothetical protein
VTLDEYDGNLSDLLRGILQECGCETRIPVKKYAFYEGRVFQRYKVGIMLPAKLGISVVMPAGEARTVSTAYKIAVMKAITDIRKHKTKKLLGTKFTSHTTRKEKILVGIATNLRRDTHMLQQSTWTGVSICLVCSITFTEH